MPAQEEDPHMPAFQEWKKKWYKNYATPDEEEASFQTFKENLLHSSRYHPPPPPGLTVSELLDDKADRPFMEHFGYIRLDRALADDNGNSDSDEDTFLLLVPVEKKKDDGSHDGFVRGKYGSIKFKVERRPRNAATVKPVKRTSDDTKEEDNVKRQ
ncbi:hypothetical protein CTI12_AA321530 [Artemisia annua]|uniref:Uncharacterized protein n=1 Tax=Artemisia annua TaxID=35608 RepID=A0A2U1MPQ6_ARTAN|nr:hypothetical protein CTI12_AA321530 [Artemisia annua]